MKLTFLALSVAIALIPMTSGVARADTAASADDGNADSGAANDEPNALPKVVVNALPFRQSADDVITPVVVLSGAELDRVKANTIGETVAGEIGVQTTAFGAGVGRPVIRGLDGSRVSVLSNGLNSGDVSAVSQDHAVAIEPFLADQIEILKGPSTLLYGSGAVGGVVNVVDGRIPQALPENGFSGRAELRGNSVANEPTGMARIDAGSGNFAFHFDGVWRDADDYSIPGGTLANSFVETKTGAFGTSYIGERGFVGFAVSRYLDNYGNPAEPGDDEEAGVTLQLAQTRYDVKGELSKPLPGFDTLRFSVNHIDYKHTEFEGSEVGTVFLSSGNEGRIEFMQTQLAGWDGAFGLQFLDREFEAVGEEAFVPKTATRGYGLFGIEQREFGAFKLELGARVDKVSSDPIDAAKVDFTPLSFSLGGSYRLSDLWHLTANLDRAQRAPAEEELFANGPHIATQSFEIGDSGLSEETSKQFELGLHFHSDMLEARVAMYANRFDDFIYLLDTDEIEDDLAVREWTQADAKFHGFEGEAKFKLADNASGRYDLRLWGDTVNARLNDGGNLPRIAPARAGVDLEWKSDLWQASIGAAHYFAQDKVPEFETETSSFTLLNAHVTYALTPSARLNWEIFADATNLTNQTARLATSYIKDVAPLPGRSFVLGVRAFF